MINNCYKANPSPAIAASVAASDNNIGIVRCMKLARRIMNRVLSHDIGIK